MEIKAWSLSIFAIINRIFPNSSHGAAAIPPKRSRGHRNRTTSLSLKPPCSVVSWGRSREPHLLQRENISLLPRETTDFLWAQQVTTSLSAHNGQPCAASALVAFTVSTQGPFRLETLHEKTQLCPGSRSQSRPKNSDTICIAKNHQTGLTHMTLIHRSTTLWGKYYQPKLIHESPESHR